MFLIIKPHCLSFNTCLISLSRYLSVNCVKPRGMMKPIMIVYQLDNQDKSITIPILYQIAEENSVRTITCIVDQKKEQAIPIWLRPFKFEIKSICNNGVYETLFSDYSNVRNLEASLFIDKVCADIITLENTITVAIPTKPIKKKTIAITHT